MSILGVKWVLDEYFSTCTLAEPLGLCGSPGVYSAPKHPKHKIHRSTTACYLLCFFIDYYFFPHQSPLLSPQDILVPTIPIDKCSRTPSNASHSRSTKIARKKEESFLAPLAHSFFSIVTLGLFFHLLFLNLSYNIPNLAFAKQLWAIFLLFCVFQLSPLVIFPL